MNNKIIQTILFLTLIFLTSQKIFAETNYVSLTGNHIPPYTNWHDAATNIQSAVYAAEIGNTVLVNDGTYYPANQIYIKHKMTVKSVNGAEKTIVDGCFPAQTNRCFYLGYYASTIDGFTIVNGYATNCNVKSYDRQDAGGGVYCKGTILNCIIRGNSAANGGGGVYCDYGDLIQNCTIVENSSDLHGGGIVLNNGVISNCIVRKNFSVLCGGGMFASDAQILNCIISENYAYYAGGIDSLTCYIQNCLIYNNIAQHRGGGAHIAFNTYLVNSTICKNKSTDTQVDGVFCHGYGPFIYNTIIYAHVGEGLWYNNGFENHASRVRTLKTYTKNCWFGRPPGFIDIKNNDFRLSRKSPCINRGSFTVSHVGNFLNQTDLAGNPRVSNGRIDIGAYECNRDIFAKYNIKWNKSDRDQIILKSKFKDYKNLGENLSVKVGNNFIVSNLEPFKVTSKVAKYKSNTPKCKATLKVKPVGILTKIKCSELNKLDHVMNITNETAIISWRYIDVKYYLGTNIFTDRILTKYRSKKDKFCKGQKP